jgi:uncharacterized Zn-finger protein
MVPPNFHTSEKTGEQTMADRVVPHFHNTQGVPAVTIGAREFMCVGALPPFDHPHVFLDMGDDVEAICPYCSTVYRYDGTFEPTRSDPPDSLYTPGA